MELFPGRLKELLICSQRENKVIELDVNFFFSQKNARKNKVLNPKLGKVGLWKEQKGKDGDGRGTFNQGV